jgi:23S rRNA (uracil1939-C5)-methyltransferase
VSDGPTQGLRLKTPLSNPLELTIEKVVYGGDGLARMAPRAAPRPAVADRAAQSSGETKSPENSPASETSAAGAAVEGHAGALSKAGPTGERRMAVFVPYTLAGERVRAVVESNAHGFARARLLHVIESSQERVAPGCEYFFRCGGCQLQHARYEHQLEIKREVLLETLRRTGGTFVAPAPAIHAGEPWHYRNRTRLRLLRALTGGALRPRLGFLERGSHDILEVTHCPISSPLINRAMDATLRLDAPPPSAREIEFFADADDQNLLVEASFSVVGRPEREWASALASTLAEFTAASSVAAADQDSRVVVAGVGFVEYRAAGHRFRVSHGSFFQVNRRLIDELAHTAARTASKRGAVLDLFSGVGLFAVPLAERCVSLTAVESNETAVADLRQNTASLPNVEIAEGDALRFLRPLRRPLDLVVADPPRGGLGKAVVGELLRLQPAEICLVSCDPATLGRDLGVLTTGGYQITEMDLFDLFPQTYHLETVVRLNRNS